MVSYQSVRARSRLRQRRRVSARNRSRRPLHRQNFPYALGSAAVRLRSTALPSLPTKRTLLPSMYDTGLVSGEDSTTIGEGGSTGLRPGLNAVTVPTLTAPVVICVGARSV